jgi:alpha-D-ribose 1-methylphosphonate 5-triphosphate synthase subunit PhnH
MDFETPLWLDDALKDDRAVVDALRFHCGCPVIDDPARANFALIGDACRAPLLSAFHQGTPEYPDRSTTVVMQVRDLAEAGGVRLTGPGVKTQMSLHVDGLPADFWRQWSANHRQFPLGVDLILTAGDRIAALPRSIRVEV